MSRSGNRHRRPEWPTVALAGGIYAGWLAATFWFDAMPLVAAVAVGAVLIALHGSLQHELVHGHPTRSARANAAFAALPLGLWMPFHIYRTTHLDHHGSRLTDPVDDPESFYVTPQRWARMGPTARALAWVHTTLLGRLALGPAVTVSRFARDELARLRRGDYRNSRAWAAHAAGTAVVLVWVIGVCDMSPVAYLCAFAYPGLSLTLLRSFAEHAREADPHLRTATVESRWLGAVFLWNNLHVLHHRWPGIPWYRYWDVYRRRRAELVSDSCKVLPSYWSIARQYAVRPVDHPAALRGRAHLDRASARAVRDGGALA